MKLFRDYSIDVRGAVELSDVAQQKYPEIQGKCSLAALAARALGCAIDKPNGLRCGDWEVRTLSR